MLDRVFHAGAILAVAWLFSVDRRAIRPRVVLAGTLSNLTSAAIAGLFIAG